VNVYVKKHILGEYNMKTVKRTRTKIPKGIDRVRNAVTGEVKVKCKKCGKFYDQLGVCSDCLE
jgi:hypothetical protein